MKDKRPEILYSDQVSEIISDPPRRLVRWGTTAIFSVFVLALILSWLIKYPDIVPAPVEITTTNPPATLVAKKSGHISELYVHDSEKVTEGKLLAVMETAASINEFEKLKILTDTVEKPEMLSLASFPGFSGLGELQPLYATFLKSLSEYEIYVRNDLYSYKISSVKTELINLQDYIGKLKVKERLLQDNLKLGKKQFERDSTLFSSKVMAESDYENSRKTYNNNILLLQNLRLEQSSKVMELTEKKQQLNDYTILRDQERLKLASSLREAWQNLRAEMRIWEITYLLVAPVKGTVTFTKFWSRNQTVVSGEPVLSIVPDEAGDMIGRINLSMERSGKVRVGSKVNIKLSGYPFLEYGMVKGIVSSKSLVPSGENYVIEVTLPQGLTTLYGIKLDFTQNMQGTAEILTDDMRLLQKLFNPFRHLISKNRG
jgi:multidrug resistance efflux pump